MEEKLGWEECEVGFLFETVTGNTPSKKDPANYGFDVPFIKPPELDNSVIKNASEFLSNEGAEKARIVQEGAVLVTCIGNLGRVGLNKKKIAFNQQINAIKPTSYIESKFTFYQAQSLFFKNQLENLASATTVAIVNKSKFDSIRFFVAPLPEQRAIVSKIEQLFSDLDNGIANLRLAQEQLKVYRQAVLKKAFEGELTRKWREQQTDLPDARDLLEQIRKEREEVAKASGKKVKPVKPLNEDEIAELPGLPEGWGWVKLQELCDLMGGVTKGRNLEGKKKRSLPYLRVANVQDGYLDLSEMKYIEALESDLEKYRLEKGDILYTEGGDKDKLGRGTIWNGQIENCIHQNHIFRARPYSNELESLYVGYFSQTKTAKNYFFKKAKQTVNLASINMTVLSNLPFPLTSLPEQHAIVEEIETRLSVCDKMAQDIDEALEKAEALRQSILKKAFEGKLLSERELAEVRSAEDWEPAEVLLERIKMKKEGKEKR